jgi:hypothetical protein
MNKFVKGQVETTEDRGEDRRKQDQQGREQTLEYHAGG